MSNEELVKLINSGHSELVEPLWNQVIGFIEQQATKRLYNAPNHLQSLRGDMINQSYLYFLKAIKNYHSGEKSFIGYLSFYIKSAFNDVIFSGRSAKKRNDPLNYATSLETPVNENEEDMKLLEIILDETSTAYYNRIEDTDYWGYMRNLILEGAQKEGAFVFKIVITMLEYDVTLPQARKMMGGTDKGRGRYQRAFERGCRAIRHHIIKRISQDERNGREDIYFYEMGLASWKNNKYTSGVETAVLRRLEAEQRVRDSKDMLKCY